MTPLLSTPLLRAQSDRRLAALAADGHDRAFEAIVERYRRPLQRYLRRLLSEALAEDVLQASFVRAWQALRAGTEVRDLRPWLYRIAHNQALNTLRAAGSALPAATEDLPVVSPETQVERREELRATLHGIQALPERQRAALVAVAVADRPHADVAAELGMSDGALRQLLLRARTTLRAAATALTPYPLMTWLAGGQEATAARVAEMAVGVGGAGVAVKAGAAVLAAGAVVAAGPALRGDDQAPARAKAGAESREAHRQAAPRRAVAAVGPAPSPDHAAGDQGGVFGDAPAGRHASGARSRSGHGGGGSPSRGSGSSGSSSSGPGSGGAGSGGAGSGEAEGSSGPGSGESGSGASGSGGSGGSEDSSGTGSGDSSGTGSSGKGTSGRRHSGEDAPQAQPAPVVPAATAPGPVIVTEPQPSNSGEGSDSSGSGTAGSGSWGSGSSGSGHDGTGDG
jgi:RNA polymerase sigma factor (sigma-70 family)